MTTERQNLTPAQKRKEIIGTVVSDKMDKTIVVKVDRQVKHGMYMKYVLKSRKYLAHDPNESANPGDFVKLVETRPLSRHKRWALKEIVRRGRTVESVVD